MTKMLRHQISAVLSSPRHRQYNLLFLFSILPLFVVCLLTLPSYGSEGETETVITSDSLEYFSETKQYVGKGSVEIHQKDAVVNADEITYDEATSDVSAQGRVFYHEPDITIEAGKAKLNLESKTGRLFDAKIFYGKGNVYLWGEEIERRDENSYYSPSASFTTCDAPVPDWCFQGKNVDAVLGENLQARDASFKIQNVPVLHTPYLYSPLLRKRQTGFLLPVVSQSDTRGFGLHVPFFWAISENRDATFVLDAYSKVGIGEGMEYRFVEPHDVKGSAWAYHIRDNEANKDYWEVKGLYENRPAVGIGGFLNVNYLNEEDFYREFNTQLETRTKRYLESAGELNLPLNNSRLYLLSEYWIDLKTHTPDVAQKLPEAGYVLNYTNIGGPLVSGSLTAANMWRDGGLSAGRIDLYPKLLHSFGTDFVVTQTAAVRATEYSFYNDESDESMDGGLMRAGFEYSVVGHTRLYRKYGPFLHVIEPSVGYHYISASENDLPVFDVTDLFKRTSLFELSMLNRFITNGNEVATVRLTQDIDTYSDHPFLPLRLDVAINKGTPIVLTATYNTNTGSLETVSSEILLRIMKANVGLGQTYNRAEDIMLYKAGIEFSPTRSVNISGGIWYDAKGGGLRDLDVALRYQRQCWGLKLEMVKSPGNFTTLFTVQLAGLNSDPAVDNDKGPRKDNMMYSPSGVQ